MKIKGKGSQHINQLMLAHTSQRWYYSPLRSVVFKEHPAAQQQCGILIYTSPAIHEDISTHPQPSRWKVITLSLYDCSVMTTARQGETKMMLPLKRFLDNSCCTYSFFSREQKHQPPLPEWLHKKAKGASTGKRSAFQSGKLVHLGRTGTPRKPGKSTVNRKYRAKKRTRSVPCTELW